MSSNDAVGPLQDLLAQFSDRLASVEAKIGLETPSGGGGGGGGGAAAAGGGGGGGGDAPQVTAFDSDVTTLVTAFTAACSKLGPAIEELGDITKRGFEAQRALVVLASKCKQGDLQPHLSDIKAVYLDMKGSVDPRSDHVNHAKAVNEAVQSANWLMMPSGAADFVSEAIGSTDFWANKVRVEYKAKSPEHVEFCVALKALLQGLVKYIKAHHVPGLKWNPRGGSTADYGGGGGGGGASAAAAPAPAAAPARAPAAPAGGGMSSVFAGIKSIDQSSGKTAGLKAVTKDMQTWRSEYKGGDKPAPKAAAAPKPKPKPTAAAKPKPPPVCELQRDRWIIEHQVGPDVVTVKDLNMKQQVYIYGCENATIVLEGKCKTIAIDKCVKTQVVFDSAVSACELVNCRSMKVQCKGQVPSVAIDKTDGVVVYLSEEAKGAQIVTSKSSEMNVSFPKEGTDEWTEVPIPEQFVNKIQPDGTLKSEVSELYS